MKTLIDEYKECLGGDPLACQFCKDKRLRHVMTYACGEVVDVVAGMGEYCIWHSQKNYEVGCGII